MENVIKDELDKAMDRAKTSEDYGIIGALLCAHMNLNMAKDILKGNWHYRMAMNPQYYMELVQMQIAEAELNLRSAELQIQSIKEGFTIDET